MKKIILAVASTLIVGSAFAQTTVAPTTTPATSGMAVRPMKVSSDKSAMAVDKHIKSLHDRLKITPAEEAQWTPVAQAMRDNALGLDTLVDKREMGGMSAVDDLNAYGDIAQAHADGVKKLSAAFTPLYNAMPDDQKKLADSVFSKHAHTMKKTASS